MTLEQMRLRLQEIAERIDDLEKTIEAEKRDYVDEEDQEIRKLLDEAETLEKNMEREEKRLAFKDKMQATSPGQDDVKKAVSTDIDDKRNFAQTVTQSGPRRSDPNRFFATLGDQLLAIRNAGLGRRIDQRLYEVHGAQRAATGLGESVGADGGFMLQPTFAQMIMEDAFQTGKLAPMCRNITIGTNSNSLKIPAVDETSRASTRHGGTLGYWVAEADEKTASQPKVRQLELNLNKMVVLVYATDELLDDLPAMENFVRTSASHEIGFQLDTAIFNGNGAGKPLGIVQAGCLVSVTKEAGQAAATVVYENIVKMWSRLFAVSQTNAVWLINQNVFPQLAQMSLSVGTGGSAVWLPAGGASASPYSTLMGRPVIPIEQCETLGTVGDIVLADFSNGYIFATKGGLQTDMSIHVRFIYDESVFRFVFRADGQPVRASALTPYKGGSGATQSHFIALETRS
jgi:HK97 family phage major capsid protein